MNALNSQTQLLDETALDVQAATKGCMLSKCAADSEQQVPAHHAQCTGSVNALHISRMHRAAANRAPRPSYTQPCPTTRCAGKCPISNTRRFQLQQHGRPTPHDSTPTRTVQASCPAPVRCPPQSHHPVWGRCHHTSAAHPPWGTAGPPPPPLLLHCRARPQPVCVITRHVADFSEGSGTPKLQKHVAAVTAVMDPS